MILSRFWYLFLAVTAAAGMAAAILAQHVINDGNATALQDALRRDRATVDVQLALEARARLDRLAFISVDERFGALLHQASQIDEESRLRPVSLEVKTALQQQVRKLEQAKNQAPNLAFALDKHGRIVAQLGPLAANPPGASLQTYPLVQRVLQGYVRDDIWLYDRKVYRMAGRPVVSGTQYAGAILHGYRLDETLASQLASGLQGATVAFFHQDKIIASYGPEGAVNPGAEVIQGALPATLKTTDLREQGRSDFVDLQGDGRALFALLPGSTVDANVGVVVARSLVQLESPVALFTTASQQDVAGLPVLELAGAALLAAVLGLLFIWLERDRHLHSLRMGLLQLVNGERERLIITDWSGTYRVVADLVNQVVERATDGGGLSPAGKPRKANLDEILGPTPGESGAQPFFGFAPTQTQGGNPDDPFMFASPHASEGVPAQPAAPLMPASPPGPPPTLEATNTEANATSTPHTPPAPPPSATTNGSPPPPPPPQQPPARPQVQSTPRMAAVAAAALPAVPMLAIPDKSPDELAHFREVFEAYLESRKRCGEGVDNLTYEKFEQTLDRTRSQILSKHKASGVRFTVYEKQGKTALKAAPIRE